MHISALLKAVLVAALCSALFAQQPPPRRPGGGPPRAAPAPDDNTGFEPIFDGSSLKNWEGDETFWRVEGGAITGETTPEKVLKQNTFIIWRGGTTRNFELKAEYRITASGNSGVQYRSAPLPDVGKFVLKGYQCDIDGKDNFTGMLYEERGRGFLAERGQFVRVTPGRTRKMIGSPGSSADLKALLKPEDWNQIHIIAHGNMITHVMNGRVMSILIDDDPEGRAADGLLGLQLHMGPPMKIEYRNVMLRKLD